jgi:allophanate hydrolase subunit 1
VTHASAVIDQRPAHGDRPAVTYRHAGDRYLMVEYGDMVLDMTLNFFVQAVDRLVREAQIQGLVETSPGFRSMLVGHDAAVLARDELIRRLDEVHDAVPDQRQLTIPSRLITLPIAFDESQSREAVERYLRVTRADAPNAQGGNNIDYIVAYNGLPDREALYAEILATEWWNAFTGFFPGLPFMFPLDTRHEIFAPKYNPTRLWTAEGAVGIGGPCVAIYPVESPGGYQLFGRTIPIYDIRQRNPAFRDDPILIKPADRVQFERVEEDELLAAFTAVHDGGYRYRIEDAPFSVEAWLQQADAHRDEADAARAVRERASRETPVP